MATFTLTHIPGKGPSCFLLQPLTFSSLVFGHSHPWSGGAAFDCLLLLEKTGSYRPPEDPWMDFKTSVGVDGEEVTHLFYFLFC